jgi:hypothetical protein
MLKNPVLRRFLLVLALLPSVLVAQHGWDRWKEERVAVWRYAYSYERITVSMPEDQVEQLLGGKGVEITNHRWPKVLGELPGYEKVIQETFRLPAGRVLKRETWKSQPIRWKKWDDLPGRDRWIAVAFAEGTLGVPHVVAKSRATLDRARRAEMTGR